MPNPVQLLAQPLCFPVSGRTAPNRFLKGAMSERLASWDPHPLHRGVPSRELAEVYEVWGRGRIGVLVTGNIMVDPAHPEAVGNAAVPFGASASSGRFEAFKDVARAGKKHGSLMIAQISHPGRQCDVRIQPDPVSASDVQLQGTVMGMRFGRPHAAQGEEIARIVRQFQFAAKYLELAGFDGVEVHAAHGYLVAQFLSPTTNRRGDGYGGGSLEGRARLLVEIVRAIREGTSPGFVVGVKLNSVEFQQGGLRPEEARELCAVLDGMGVDFVELSGGTYEAPAFAHREESTRTREAFFIEFANLIAPSLRRTSTYLTGGFQTAAAMADALATVDGVGLGRALCHEPFLCRSILSGSAPGAASSRVDADNVALSNAAALMQMWRLALGKQPWDTSSQDGMKAMLRVLARYRREFDEADFNAPDDFRKNVLAAL